SMLDVYMLLFVGILGYVLRKLGFQLAPLVVGLVLGPLIEKHFREGLLMSVGDISVFYSSPIAIGIWVVVLLVMTGGLQRLFFQKVFGVGSKEIAMENSE